MRRAIRRRALPAAATVLVLLGALTGCVRMPTDGGVVEAGPGQQTTRVPGISIDPRPPQRGATPAEIVEGFLDAMLATPTQTRSARLFLTEGARSSWDPVRSTVVYGEKRAPRGGATGVTVDVEDAYRLDAHGAWQGALPAAEQRLSFRMARENGQWRIAQAPNALVVPTSWFETRFSQLSLYFFDPTVSALVPEPVFVPRGNQLATSLVRDLIAGPPAGLADTLRSFVPPGVGGGLSVPVDADGIADLALTADPEASTQLSPQGLTLLTAQLAWTLRQDPSISAIRLSIGGRPVQLPSGRTEFSVADGPEYDPAGYQTSTQLFGLDGRGRLVSGQPPTLEPVPGPFGQRPAGLRAVAVDLDGQQVAGVTLGGTRVRLASVGGEGTPTTIATGTDLLRPAWDVDGRLWLLDRTRGGARVSYRTADGALRPLEVPGVTGADVVRMLVSRDGTRLVAVRRGAVGDTVVVSRLRSDEEGRVLAASPAVQISPTESAPMRIKDVAWSSPTTLLLLHRLAGATQLRSIVVDGSSAAFPAQPIVVADQVDALLSSPVDGEGAYGVYGTQMRGLTGDTRDSVLNGPVTSLVFAG